MKIREEARPLAHRNPSFMPKLSRFQRNERLANANHYVVARVPGIPDVQAAPILPIRPPSRKLKFPLSQMQKVSGVFQLTNLHIIAPSIPPPKAPPKTECKQGVRRVL